MKYNIDHRGDVYPTHGVGPACQLLDIHRGDRMTTLVSMDTKAVNGPAYIEETTGKRPETFLNGDHTMTMIRTANGKTIHIQRMTYYTGGHIHACISLHRHKGIRHGHHPGAYPFEPERVPTALCKPLKLQAPPVSSPQLPKGSGGKIYPHPIIPEVGEQAKGKVDTVEWTI